MAVPGEEDAAPSTTLDASFIISLIRRLLPQGEAGEPHDATGGDARGDASGSGGGSGGDGGSDAGDAEQAGCVLWDLSACPEHAHFLLRHQLPRVAAAALLREPAPSSRTQELLLGCLANLACSNAAALAEDPEVVMALLGAGLCGAMDAAALGEALRGVRACARERAWRDALRGLDGATERALALLAGSRDAALAARCADCVTALALHGGAEECERLRGAGALTAALAALTRLGGGDGGDGGDDGAGDAAARCVEALVCDAGAVPYIREALHDGSLDGALLPPLQQQAEAPALAGSAAVALSCALAALRDAADGGGGGDDACAAVEALLRAVAADAGALRALRALAHGGDGSWGGGGDGDAEHAAEAAREVLDALRAATTVTDSAR
jgi:hypothetical protein